jgi:hypothetical protein
VDLGWLLWDGIESAPWLLDWSVNALPAGLQASLV